MNVFTRRPERMRKPRLGDSVTFTRFGFRHSGTVIKVDHNWVTIETIDGKRHPMKKGRVEVWTPRDRLC
jgi:hypothetical protein